jgi:hypothetical protein
MAGGGQATQAQSIGFDGGEIEAVQELAILHPIAGERRRRNRAVGARLTNPAGPDIGRGEAQVDPQAVIRMLDMDDPNIGVEKKMRRRRERQKQNYQDGDNATAGPEDGWRPRTTG